MVKEFLSQKGAVFKEYDVSQDRAAAQELMKKTGQMAVPVITINGDTIIGFDRARLEQALSRQPRQRPSFGASIADASKITARQGSVITFGAYIGNVRAGSVSERVGLKQGDIITELNMQNIAKASDLESVLSRLNPGSRISLVFLRGNKTLRAEGTM
jgi:glutaredoxin